MSQFHHIECNLAGIVMTVPVLVFLEPGETRAFSFLALLMVRICKRGGSSKRYLQDFALHRSLHKLRGQN